MKGLHHQRIQAAAALPLMLGAAQFMTVEQILASSAGYAIGFIVTPDWDLIHTRSKRIFKHIPIVRQYVNLYARIINFGKRPFVHRGISHIPIIGTLTRFLWLFPLALLPLPEYVFLGLAVADFIHFLCDGARIRLL